MSLYSRIYISYTRIQNESIVFTIEIKSYHVENSINDDNNYNSKYKELHGSYNGRCWGMSIAHIVLFIGALDPPFLFLELVQRLLNPSIVLECNATAPSTAGIRRHVRSLSSDETPRGDHHWVHTN